MGNFADTLSSMNYGLLFIWIVRIGLIITLIGLCTLPKKKPNLKKIVTTQKKGRMETKNPIVRRAEGLMEKGILKGLRITDKKEYDKVQRKIDAAGGLYNATPQTIQFFRIIIPIVLMLILVPTYIINVKVQAIKTTRELTKTEQVESAMMSDNSMDAVNVFLDTGDTSGGALQQVNIQQVNPIVLLWLFILPLGAYFVPDLYLWYLSKKRLALVKSEIPTFRTFAVSMLETKTYPVYDILKILVGSTNVMKEDLIQCMNEYFVDSKAALKHLHDKIDDTEFHIVCNALLQAVDEDKETTLMFLKQQLAQYDALKKLKEEEKIKKKSNYFVIVLGMPLVCVLVIWFYPWFLEAMQVLGSL